MTLPVPSAAAIAALTPQGRLRAAINLSNFLLVTGKDDNNNPEGVSPDMARALGEQLGVPVELVKYRTPGEVADDGATGRWDIGNIGAEPQRAEFIDFTPAYCEIEATYLVRGDSGITSIDEVDQPGRTVVAPPRAAYGLWLERNLKHATLHQPEDLRGAYDLWVNGGYDALGGLRPGLIGDAAKTPGAVLLDGRFSTVQQAIGTPKDRDPAGFSYLKEFVEAAKAEGLVGGFIEAHGVEGLSVAPPADG